MQRLAAMLVEAGRLLIVDDDRPFIEELRTDGLRLGLSVDAVNDPALFAQKLIDWRPTIIAMDLVMPGSDGLELLQTCERFKFSGHLILMSGGFEIYLHWADQMAVARGLRVVAKLPKPFRPKQFSYLLMSLI
jgi:CheY-like chemotaxis protein